MDLKAECRTPSSTEWYDTIFNTMGKISHKRSPFEISFPLISYKNISKKSNSFVTRFYISYLCHSYFFVNSN